MVIKEKLKQSMILRIVLLLIIGIPVGILALDNEVVFSLGIILLFVMAIKSENSKRK